MKKFLSMAIALVLIMSLSLSSALAAKIDMSAPCQYTNVYKVNGETWNSGTHTGKVYVYHTVDHSVKYNNHFYATKNGSSLASSWLTPGVNSAISSSSITANSTIGLNGRGNTYYYENEGVKYVTFGGTFGWPL